jgi:hypothetical protein
MRNTSPLTFIIAPVRPPHLPCRENGAGVPIVDVCAAPTRVPTGDAPSNTHPAGALSDLLASHPFARPAHAPRPQLKTP